MKAGEITKCAICGKGVMAGGMPLFWRVTCERMGVDLAAVKREVGMELLMGGNVALARVLGPDEDIAAPFGAPRTVLVCEACAGMPTSVYQLGLEE
jgi:hypothetical protein